MGSTAAFTGTVNVSPGKVWVSIPCRSACGRHGNHLRGSKYLAKSLVLAEVESPIPPVINSRKHNRAAIGESKFIAHKGRDAPLSGRIFVIEVIACIERCIAHEFEQAPVHLVRSRLGHHIGKTSRAVSDLGRHHSRISLHLLNRIYIEIGKRRPSQLRIGGVKPIDGENRSRTALAIHCKLLRKIRRPIRISHRARRQQQQLAEVARIER